MSEEAIRTFSKSAAAIRHAMIRMRVALCVGLLMVSSSPAQGQSAPTAARGIQELSIGYDECTSRARRALESEGYSIGWNAGNGRDSIYTGQKGLHVAMITCTVGAERRFVVNVFVASNATEVPASDRTKLQHRMDPQAGAPANCSMAGVWQQEAVGKSVWTISANGDAVEKGLGDQRGTATMTGRTLRIDWGRTPSGSYSGTYQWNLDDSCNSGSGLLTFAGTSGGNASTVRRIGKQQTLQDAGGGPRPGHVCTALAGNWSQQSERGGQSVWRVTSTGEATETGLGSATGRAFFNGSTLRIDWRTGSYAGYYEWDLDPSCSAGSGVLVFTAGASGSQKSNVRK